MARCDWREGPTARLAGILACVFVAVCGCLWRLIGGWSNGYIGVYHIMAVCGVLLEDGWRLIGGEGNGFQRLVRIVLNV